MTNPQEGVQGNCFAALAVQGEASSRKLDRKGGRMRAFTVPMLNGLVGDEPGVSPAPNVISFGVFPTGNVAFV